ncbi:MAG: G-D-S-L family lipolytic protein [Gammaproteobacteria bacterium]|nr:G-D-S-L family lipolytic protein [Gammaproteobacteria bacterium]
MKILLQRYCFAVAVIALITACGTDISGSIDDDADPGSADFSTFIAVGDSLTAGYADAALYRHGQENSFPAILAQQFALAGGGAFRQPLMPVAATGSLTAGGPAVPGISDRLVLVPTGDPDRPASPQPIVPAVSTEIVPSLTGSFNNMGVPGAKSFHLGATGYSAANPYYSRFASGAAASVITDAAVLQTPTFFVLWIGNNDVLSFATDGGASGIDQTGNPNPAGYGSTDITDPGYFAGAMGYPALVAALTAGGAKGVLVNIPDVSTIPYFTTVAFNAIPMDAAQANTANAGFTLYNLGVQSLIGAVGPCTVTQAEADRRLISFTEGQNRIVILDETLSDLTCLAPQLVNMRQATADDFIVLPTSSKLGEDAGGGLLWGISAPLVDADVLLDSEIDVVNTARLAYNVTIKAAADADPNLLLFDASALLEELNTTGILYGSGGISSTFAQGGGFSLDGVHPTARGYAVIANEIFKLIEDGFGASIPPVDPSDYSTVFYQ